MPSILAWHAAHAGLLRCCSSRCRTLLAVVSSAASTSAGTSGGGGGGGEPSNVCITHLPRATGDVLLSVEVSVSTLDCPSSPRRFSSATSTRRKRLPSTLGIP